MFPQRWVRILAILLVAGAISLQAASPVRVLVFADGYHYGPAAYELAGCLDSSLVPGISAEFANTENILEPAALARCDVLVLFNHNDITLVHEKNITQFVNAGGGLVALHHVINRANNNFELNRLVGGYYRLEDGLVEHRDFNILRLAGADHPVLAGIPDKFKIYDDQDFRMLSYPGEPVTRLLSCDVTDNGDQQDCGWVRTEGAGRVIYLSPGDPVKKSPFIKNEPLFRLIVNAIRWAAGAD
ncbi:MAG TPA: ThuA domain-containing protein [Candidatus Glassbacteria bacterium]|nr:ThuA domain-containing protein [Candidatus Glassbacteria bacterium]